MFDGIITPIVTPFHRDEEQSINYEATKQLIDHLIAKGVKGIFILGSNGEFHVIDEAEKIEFAEKVIGMVDHRVPVLSLIHIFTVLRFHWRNSVRLAMMIFLRRLFNP